MASAYSEQEKSLESVLYPCMNIKHTDEVTLCLKDLSKKKEIEYSKQFENYIKKIRSLKEGKDSEERMIMLEEKAKKGWDMYAENSCLASVILYEKGSYGYNADYDICLIKNYSQRIDFYKTNQF